MEEVWASLPPASVACVTQCSHTWAPKASEPNADRWLGIKKKDTRTQARKRKEKVV